jgi:hypothetical protein
MMQRREGLAFAAAVFAALVAIARIARVGEDPVESAVQSDAVSAGAVAVDDDSLTEAAANAVANDPFRLANRPSGVRYDARTEGAPGGAPFVAPPVRPQFVVKAIVGGPPWQAVVDGIPGQPAGTIVRGGVTFDKLTVRSVGRDTVVIAAPDTTWKLTLARGRS